jgi:hypothetical protein
LYGEILDRKGNVIRPWKYLTSACRDPNKVGATKKRILHWSDVRAAIKRVGVPRASVDGPEFTLVNLRTTFYTRAGAFDRTLTILGFVVDVHIEPTGYIWHWGDDHTTTTHTPGRPYPARDVTHAYAHSTPPDGPLPLRVDVAYRARFRVDGGAWITVNDQLVIAGKTRYLPVKQASAVLVPPGR